MGWSDAYQYLHAGAARLAGNAEAQRVDDGLPLRARIGSLLTLQQAALIRAVVDGSLVTLPAPGDTRIEAVSQLKLNQSGGLYRYYLNKGDIDADEKFLQIYQDPHGNVAEILYCTQLARVIPESAEQQQAYMGEAGYGLGDRSYTLSRAQLEADGVAADLALVFGAGDSLEFWRDAGADAAFLPPFRGNEVRLDDAGGRQGLRQEIYFMPYVRQLRGGGKEYLLITTELIQSVNGDPGQRGIHVDFVIGIPVEQERIVLQ
ncbi:MAG: hypothetical protein ACEQSK_01645 [Sphingomonadaceae bacterium]